MRKPWTGPPLKQCPQHGHFTAAVCPVCGKPEPGNMTWEEKRNEISIHNQVPDTGSKRHAAPALERTAAREETGVGRVRVRFTGHRCRPCDPDSFAGSCKGLLDFLHRSGLIEGDEPWRIILETDQVRVRSFAEEKTEIVIDYPE